MFVVKCAISGNNHFFAFFISSWYVNEIWPGWELAIGLAFSEFKMAANLQRLYYKRGEPYLCSANAPVLDGSGSRR